MSWDERLFGAFYSLLFQNSKRSSSELSCLKLDEVRRQSEVLLSALCEAPIELRGSSGWGGLHGRVLFLPEDFSFLPDKVSQGFYLEWRLLAAHLDWDRRGMMREPKSLELVMERFPRLSTNFIHLKKIMDKYPLEAWLGTFTANERHSSSDALKNLPTTVSSTDALSRGTEKQGKTQDRAQRIQIEEKQDNPLTHVFEKVLTAEDYHGGQRRMDGRDELEDHSEALNDLNLSQVVRTNQSTQSILKSNAIIEVADLNFETKNAIQSQRIFQYPEWFESKRDYRKDWCTVIESTAVSDGTALNYNRKVAEELKQKVECSFSSYQWSSKQKDGPEIDLNLAIDRFVQLKVGGFVPENIYKKKILNHHDFAIQIVVDTSLSTDSYALGKRIIDTTQEALNIFAAAFDGVLDLISIAAFSSYTRNKVNYFVLKEFEEDWSQVPVKIGSLKPDGYTRIGPVLRHSGWRLEKLKARKKMVLFISDAKPTDYDHYEGTHGINDIQRAVTELQAAGCKVKVLTLTDKKQSHHNFVFGAHHCQVLKDVKDLADSLFHFWYSSVR